MIPHLLMIATRQLLACIFMLLSISLMGCASSAPQSSSVTGRAYTTSLPVLVNNRGKHALMVDGKPYLILGAQANNSSNYPAVLDQVWPVINKLHANTLSIPVAWEQIEPHQGEFNFSYLDVLLRQAKQHHVRLILLWFATWKNNGPNYAPAWVKLNNQRYPRVVTQDGRHLNSLSPMGQYTLAADRAAFTALMTYLRDHDPDNQVIMVQVENETGTYGSKRDYSPMAQRRFEQPVPKDLTRALGVPAGNWRQVFGDDADEYFHAWFIGRYVDQVAAAGKQIKNLPMYVNAALRNPFIPGTGYSMGGPTDNVLTIWKAAAPHIDMIAPDIYFREHKVATKVLDLYARKDNPLFVAEIGNAQPYARYFFTALGHQGIGFCPFGMDDTDYVNFPLGAKEMNDQTLAPFALNYQLMAPMAADWARISFTHPVWGVSEPDRPDTDQSQLSTQQKAARFTHHLDLGRWDLEISYGRKMFWIDPPVGNTPPSGGALIAKLSDDEFLVTALHARLTFSASAEIKDQPSMIERVEEGHYEQGKWVVERIWNGDQTDWGLNFTDRPHWLKVKMASYHY